MTKGDVIATPSGTVARIKRIDGDIAICEYLGYHIEMPFCMDKLRLLGKEKPPLCPPIDLSTLIAERNQEAIEFFLRMNRKGGRKKSVFTQLAAVRDNPEAFQRLLEKLNLKGEKDADS